MTGPDEAPRTNAGPPGTSDWHAEGYNQGTREGAKQQRPPGAANPGSAHKTQREPRHRNRFQETANPHTTNPGQEWRGAAKT